MRVLVVEDIHRHTTLRAAGIELDQLTGTITREGRIIKLAAKERPVPKAGPAPLSIATAHASRAACHHPWVPRLLRKSPADYPVFRCRHRKAPELPSRAYRLGARLSRALA
jgi:hypothetical protein